ncbi:MAG: cytidine deaminase [Lachnospiraceae bacterium]|nr:cytidine deaminase [Lachnospiraceae bacterium]
MTDRELFDIAMSMCDKAYAPYSHFYVGAALITDDGSVYTGCNIENASYGATNCAERTAMFKAVSEGHAHFNRIAVAAYDGTCAYPCGICLQVMNEFMADGTVILEENGKLVDYRVSELLPHGFNL